MKKIFTLLLVLPMVASMAQTAVTFSVNMQGLDVSPNGIHVAGNFQSEAGFPTDWDPSATEMFDIGGGIYSVTVSLPQGVYEFKYINGNAWGTDETVPSECQVGGGNSNRFVVVGANDAFTPPVFFGQSAAGDAGTVFSMVRFTVDMGNTPPGASPVSVAGDFLDQIAGTNFALWVPGQAILSDILPNDNQALYTGIFYINPGVVGNYQYKYCLGNEFENVPTDCALGFNRAFSFAGNPVVMQNCYNTCETACTIQEFYNLTINVDMRYNCAFDINSSDSVDVAGTFNNYQGGPDYLLSDDDNDGIYSITLNLPAGELQYKARIIEQANFSGGWEQGSNQIINLSSDSILEARCFGLASGTCVFIPDPSLVTFSVTFENEVPASEIYVLGDFTTPIWQGGAIAMTQVAGNVYEASAEVCAASFNYKFVNGAVIDGANWESFPDPLDRDCTVPNGLGGYNRFYSRTDASPVLLDYVFNSCQVGGVVTATAEQGISKALIAPNPASDGIIITFGDAQTYRVDVVDVAGRIKQTLNTNSASIFVERGALSNGVYFVSITGEDGSRVIKKMIFN
ncbi:MAG: T9SS type A sorting domain-containing protein [Bacteroidia bacterium]